MNHLGLRIYRFYIRCTACMGEISFRTDPANTDYVLEAGATRNFEALSKAEKQAEEEERARREELSTNPMKLLEERTEASKNEMARMEALEELQELNRRQVKVDYEELLTRYENSRKEAAVSQEQQDEAYVQSIFGRDESGAVVKRLTEDTEEEYEDGKKRAKVAKLEAVTDLLTGPKPKDRKEVWEKSIGALGGDSFKKKGIGIMVKKKTVNSSKPAPKKSNETWSKASEESKSGSSNAIASGSTPGTEENSASISLVGAYSDTDSD